ncbi:MAG TPA: hypothetical protein VEC14_09325, partial [Reyranellaceae bacterium]|nr:hypothetical protein [Reyranellaceae bacterium]
MMSSFGRQLLTAAMAATLAVGTAAAQLLPPLPLPQVTVPNIPVAGEVLRPVLQDIASNPETRHVVEPTLDTVSGLPESVAQSGEATLLELRKMRLRQLIQEHRRELESDGSGQPVRRGVLLAADPDPVSLQLAVRAGFRLVAEEREPELGLRTVHLSIPRGMSAREALRRLRTVAPRLQAD